MKVYVGVSGGVDSSVALYLLKEQGYDVIAVFFKLEKEENLSRCCNVSNAQIVARKFEVPFIEVDVSEEFKELVKGYFFESLKRGFTPNPCTVCNEKIKFGIGYEKTRSLFGEGLFATGHYARIEDLHLKKGIDQIKDQSYMLWRLKKEDLQHIIFPLGNYLKSEVKSIAEFLGLPPSKESEDLCFIKGNIKDTIKEILKDNEGDIIDKHGNILGKHRGVQFYTIGQRSGLHVSYKEPLYVIDTDPINNTVVLGTYEDCLFKGAELTEINTLEEIETNKVYKAKIRYQSKPQECIVKNKNGQIEVEFLERQFAVTKGQSLVVYDEDIVVLGGVIKRALK
ncbi:tRNA 2-thiouridine(34) synthase MnmA [Caldisericum exile]|uniref:tRNA-specific 2-thiouridylase MnmA n=1 Tax=Caldisericum exile (strain DSM 21853 / NBRC 104410 / AZM16c01) TaxID=511051 RepID=A0A7U6GDT1_CALEA|nr:tRNA 2-thiouridine(34) synthase MnmA [Caldisericum exile]BAL80519.1 tRNA-specific 2-thiouridylase MnmA [Caldisericum exile AZM16c01]